MINYIVTLTTGLPQLLRYVSVLPTSLLPWATFSLPSKAFSHAAFSRLPLEGLTRAQLLPCVTTAVSLVLFTELSITSSQFSSGAQSCPTHCDPMDHSTPCLPVHHQLPELIQTHVYQVSDTIQPSHSLLSPSLPAFDLSLHQGLFR